MQPRVLSVSKDDEHRFSKRPSECISLIEGVGVDGDAHAGKRVQHLSRVAADPSAPNLRQVHLIEAEFLDELQVNGFDVKPSDLGENITTEGIDLLSLPKMTVLKIGDDAMVEITGLRNPCSQIDRFKPGLLKEALRLGQDGRVEKWAGIMGIVRAGGTVYPGDKIEVMLPESEPISLEVV